MRFWKPVILTALSFFAIATTIVYTACEKNPCNHVDCLNGGSCGGGICRCPTGFEGTRCETKSVARFLGIYSGFTGCDNGAQTIDSAFITEDFANRNYVYVKLKSDYDATGKILHGFVSANESTYAIIITNNDSFKTGSIDYLRSWNVTLQDDKKLVINSYERNETNTDDTLVHTCYFLGFKQ
jgi:hypothetical protein